MSISVARRSLRRVIISRPNNFEALAPVIRSALPEVPIIYDAEALFYVRDERQLESFIAR